MERTPETAPTPSLKPEPTPSAAPTPIPRVRNLRRVAMEIALEFTQDVALNDHPIHAFNVLMLKRQQNFSKILQEDRSEAWRHGVGIRRGQQPNKVEPHTADNYGWYADGDAWDEFMVRPLAEWDSQTLGMFLAHIFANLEGVSTSEQEAVMVNVKFRNDTRPDEGPIPVTVLVSNKDADKAGAIISLFYQQIPEFAALFDAEYPDWEAECITIADQSDQEAEFSTTDCYLVRHLLTVYLASLAELPEQLREHRLLAIALFATFQNEQRMAIKNEVMKMLQKGVLSPPIALLQAMLEPRRAEDEAYSACKQAILLRFLFRQALGIIQWEPSADSGPDDE